MAQAGDTVTYTFSEGESIAEDVSAVDTATVEYCDGAGGQPGDTTPAGSGGRVEDATIDLSGQSEIYIWVAGSGSSGRYNGEVTEGGSGGGSTEISFNNTDLNSSDDEPFIVGAGGGSGTATTGLLGFPGSDAARNNDSTPPPKGGVGPSSTGVVGNDGEGAIDDQNRGLVSGGTTIKGGGSGPGTNGEVKISYGQSAPTAPTGLTITQG
jgi:hypothetical protein